MTVHVKDLLKSPFGIAAIAGVADLTAGFFGMIADLIWLIGDLSTGLQFHPHYIAVLSLLITASVILLIGIGLTVMCYKRYKETGLESHERKIVIKHLKEKRCVKNLVKILESK